MLPLLPQVHGKRGIHSARVLTTDFSGGMNSALRSAPFAVPSRNLSCALLQFFGANANRPRGNLGGKIQPQFARGVMTSGQFDARTVGGRGGIRTHVRIAPKPDFESGAFNHSATLPAGVERIKPSPCGGQMLIDGSSGGNGASGRDRTDDRRFTKPLLYR